MFRMLVESARVVSLLAVVGGLLARGAVAGDDRGRCRARLSRGPLVVTVDEEGLTRVRDRFVVSAPVGGRVLRIELEPGDARQTW